MSPLVAAFIFGFLAGYLILRLGRHKKLTAWERLVLEPLGWLIVGASFSLATALLVVVFLHGRVG